MVRIVIPYKAYEIEQVLDALLDVSVVEIRNPVLSRRLGYYVKPLTSHNLLRFLPGTNNGGSTVLMRCCRGGRKRKLSFSGIEYVFDEELLKIPRF